MAVGEFAENIEVAVENYLKQQNLVTEEWIKDQNFITSETLSTEMNTYLNNNNYVTEQWVQNQQYIDNQSIKSFNFATQQDIVNQVNAQLNLIDHFQYGFTAPSNTKLLWIDTNEDVGGLKYYNGSEWVHVPISWT